MDTSAGTRPPSARARPYAGLHRGALADLRRAFRLDERHSRRHLGHLVAPFDRARHVLDAGASGDLSRRRGRRPDLRLGGAEDDVRRVGETDRGTAVRFWGFRAPFGAWVCIWGAFAMVTSAPFDDWWHNAYGLDVKIISPPHMLLAAGIAAIQCGAMLMALAWQNRAAGDAPASGAAVLCSAPACCCCSWRRLPPSTSSAGTCTSRTSIKSAPARSCSSSSARRAHPPPAGRRRRSRSSTRACQCS